MSGLRDEIRSILREEICCAHGWVYRARCLRPRPCGSTQARILTRFAQDLLTRAQDPAFAARVAQGRHRFDLEQHRPIGAPECVGPRQTQTRCADQNPRDRARHRRVGRGYTRAEHRQGISTNPFGARRSAAQGHSDRKE